MSIEEELKELRRFSRHGIINVLESKYQTLFTQLSPLEEKVMTECYIKGKSYCACGRKVSYCEKQIQRIVKRSIKSIEEILKEREL